MTDEQISLLVDLTQVLMNAITLALGLIGFWESTPAQNQLRGELQNILLLERFRPLPNITSDRKKIMSDLMQYASINNDIILAAD